MEDLKFNSLDMTYPLISCLCLTNNRVQFLKRAINCFNAQTYPNKELIVVYKDNDIKTIQFISQLKGENIIGYEIDSNEILLLGDIRNKAIAFCNGTYFCNWDDDDWYSIDRLTNQYALIQKHNQPVSLLTNIIMFDELNEQAYFSAIRLWEMTILCKKTEINDETKYGSSQRREDVFLLNKLMENSRVLPTVEPSLFIYFVHGNNTMHREHFEMLFGMAQKLSAKASEMIRDILCEKYSVEKSSELLKSRDFLGCLNFLSSIKFLEYGFSPA